MNMSWQYFTDISYCVRNSTDTEVIMKLKSSEQFGDWQISMTTISVNLDFTKLLLELSVVTRVVFPKNFREAEPKVTHQRLFPQGHSFHHCSESGLHPVLMLQENLWCFVFRQPASAWSICSRTSPSSIPTEMVRASMLQTVPSGLFTGFCGCGGGSRDNRP